MNNQALRKNLIYSKIFFNNAQKQLQDNRNKELIKKTVFNGVKMIITGQGENLKNYDDTELQFQLISHIKSLIGYLTPGEFMQLFPIKKDFDGHKWETKDYFYTRDYIEKLDPNIPIDEQEDPLMFIWEYVNDDIEKLNIISMVTLSKLRQYMGEPSIGEEWANMNGIETHTMHQDNKGNKFIIKDGKTLKMNKPRPRHLKLIK
jgi:hypothetical protein